MQQHISIGFSSTRMVEIIYLKKKEKEKKEERTTITTAEGKKCDENE